MRSPFILALLTALLAPALSFGQSGTSAPQPAKPEALEGDTAAVEAASGERANPFIRGELKTLSPDRYFGRHSAKPSEQFRGTDADLAPVDRRRELSPISDRNVLVPMAQTPAEGTVGYSNFNIFGNFVTYAPTDRLAVTAGMVIPTAEGDFITSISGKYKLHESRNLIVSVLPFGAYSDGAMDLDTYQLGLGTSLLADYYLSDTVVLGGGLFGFGTLRAGYDRYTDDCTRSEFQGGSCPVETVSETFPAGGHWVAATLGANWYLTESFSVNLEYILGGSWGTFFGVEGDAQGNDLESRRARFEDPEFATGFPHGQGPTVSVGGSWANGTTGLQFALVFIRQRDDSATLVIDESQEFTTVPMLSGTYNF